MLCPYYKSKFRIGSLFLAGAAFLISTCMPLEAVLLVYEPFDYASDSLVNLQNGGTGFVEAWADDSLMGNQDSISSGSLSYSGLSTSGNSLRMVSPTTPIGADVMRRFTTIPGTAGTTTWVSFLFAFEGSSAPLASGDFAALALSPTTQISYGPYFGIYDDPNGSPGDKVFGIGTSETNPVALSDIAFVPGQTYLLVASIEWHAGTAVETVNLYVNPALASAPITPDATLTALNVATNGSSGGTNRVLKTALFAGGVGTNWIFDEIRVGTTYADVAVAVPESRAGSLILLGGAFLFLRRGQLGMRGMPSSISG